MYRKSSKGWLKHFDFILIDLISLHLAFVLSYVCRHGIGNPYKNLLYRNMAFMLTFIDFFVVFLFETLKGVLRRGYYQELAATVKHVILVMLLAVLYLFTIQEGTSFSRSVLYFTAMFPSLTVAEIKNRCIPCVYWGTAIFVVVMKYSNLFFSFAFFLDRSHFAFGYELIISSEAAGFMKIICNGFTLI